ncbi:MAG: glutamate racemase [Candidatus Saccharibacteria bacterium]
MTKIGVFDSGVGGLSVVKAIKKSLPKIEIIYADDKAHVPYGNRTKQELKTFVVPILKDLEAQGCQMIVIACNTITTTLISELRKIIRVPLIGMEPMFKPAAQLTKTGVIAICATPATLKSKRYSWLKKTYTKDIDVLEPDCSDWSYMIQTDKIDQQKIAELISMTCESKADVIVLGCTHYHWIEDLIKQIAGNRATVLQPELPVIEELKRVLSQLA